LENGVICGMMGPDLDRFLLEALREDAPWGDRTTEALGISAGGRGFFLAKEPFRLCGMPAALRVLHLVDPACRAECLVAEGAEAKAGDVLARVSGSFPALLLAERTALNVLQRLSGVATFTARAVKAIEGTGARICDTRKTTPLWRSLEKYAVRTGGGTNHRMGLSDGILIKNNHIALAGSVGEAISRARGGVGHLWKVEVEVRDLREFGEAVAGGADVVLLDNMSEEEMARAVGERPPGLILEASGNMTLERLERVASLGVDLISMGALTHSAGACDISLRLEADRR
jgi:nicotinate-nucleotide pyrophosphorylase (carboxylating)